MENMKENLVWWTDSTNHLAGDAVQQIPSEDGGILRCLAKELAHLSEQCVYFYMWRPKEQKEPMSFWK